MVELISRECMLTSFESYYGFLLLSLLVWTGGRTQIVSFPDFVESRPYT